MIKKQEIYLDYNATAPILPEVIEVMVEVMQQSGNPSSVHSRGRKAKSRMEKARSIIADNINCRAQMVVFTSGGTEANNMAILGSECNRLITSNAEHDSIRSIASSFEGTVDIIPVNSDGLINLLELEKLLNENDEKSIISILYANNETGVLQDIKAIAKIARSAGALLHIDAIQALSKVPIDFMLLGVDMMSISSHKIGGPQGVGALIVQEKFPIKSFIFGGGQEIGRRGGTENIAGIVGFGRAVSMIKKSLKKMKILEIWRNEIEEKIHKHAPQASFPGNSSPRLSNVSTIYMPGVKSETQVMNFDLDQICISSGSACSSGKVKSSHVIDAMKGDKNIATSTIRMSLGWNSEYAHAKAFVKSWKKQYDRKNS
ncbi:MAG: cysteine desulfurase [Kordiimonadaceae bacterium]|jgi:cysteine desulfurase|nr:cysteine desulfurase [Kordiimonadaceae bacterium]MBT7545523.1 cysteine desulfurase [Kordiimonadaceae bacterium]MBT7606009.1 cysteine desulfurase [Kordiimonadaceae bacterium]